MRWKGDRQSTNVEDQTSRSMTPKVAGGGLGVILLAVIAFFFSGGDLSSVGDILNQGQNITPATYEVQQDHTERYKEEKEFSSVVFAHLEDYWNQTFSTLNYTYQNPTLVFYSNRVNSACGQASSQMGPFYCPGDEKVYLDLSFNEELANRYGAKGDFAMAYVIAHEVGHHVQNTLGLTRQLDSLRQRISQKEYNQYSVRLELQADYLAGTFANYLEGKTYNGKAILEVGDIKEAMQAAHAVGDDTLQQQYQGQITPETFTHGSSKQRVEWFEKGYHYGDLKHGNTFSNTLVKYPF